MKTLLRLAGLLLVVTCGSSSAVAKTPKPVSPKRFDSAAQAALAAMKARAAELKIQGVAVVAFAPGDVIEGWSSEMAVVGQLTKPSSTGTGSNLLAIAYAKAAEAANTLKDSGTSGKTPMTGEFGWRGCVIAKVPGGLIIAAFSGGKDVDDVATSQAGLEVLKKRL